MQRRSLRWDRTKHGQSPLQQCCLGQRQPSGSISQLDRQKDKIYLVKNHKIRNICNNEEKLVQDHQNTAQQTKKNQNGPLQWPYWNVQHEEYFSLDFSSLRQRSWTDPSRQKPTNQSRTQGNIGQDFCLNLETKAVSGMWMFDVALTAQFLVP